jgi:hypothetical protein
VSARPGPWTRAAGRQYVWQAPLPFPGVGTVAQLDATTWQPWLVDDRLGRAPTVSLGRPFTLLVPPMYARRSDVAQVEAQSCTWTADDTTLSVHMCHDGPPAPEDDLRVGTATAGQLAIAGDHLTIEGLAVAYVSGSGIKIETSATGTVLRRVTALATQVWMEGSGTLAEDLHASHNIRQSPLPNPDCTEATDVNPSFGIGECFHSGGDRLALLMGRQRSTRQYNQACVRCRVDRSWNLAHIAGRNTVIDSEFWGAPNHCITASDTGVTLTGNAVLNCQDSLYLGHDGFDELTVERNVFAGATYITSSSGGTGGAPVTGWTFRHNVLTRLTVDRWAFDAMTSACNVFMGTAPALRLIATNGIPGRTWQTLADAQASGLEPGSKALPPSSWTSGSMFARFTGQADPVFDFRDPLTVCGARAGIQ